MPASAADRPELVRIDSACYDYAIDSKGWNMILGAESEGDLASYNCDVFKRDNTVLGYIVYKAEQSQGELMSIFRLGVRPSLRRQKIGTHLINFALGYAKDNGFGGIEVRLPEYVFDDEENRGVDKFLRSCKVKFSRIEKGVYRHYGRTYDGVVFQRNNQGSSRIFR